MVKILVVSDLHGDFSLLPGLIEKVDPDLLMCCGDWGDPGEVSVDDFNRVIERVHTLSVYGNHDDIDLLRRLVNTDGTPVLCKNGQIVENQRLKIVGINGIWAKSHAKPWYITDEEVKEAAKDAENLNVDILITHGCAVGLNDIVYGNRPGGQRCFLEAFEILQPRVYVCGHLHNRQIRQTRDGRYAINVGQTSRGDYAYVTYDDGVWDAYVGSVNISEESS